MESLFFLVPIALIFVAIAIKILFWAIKSGQYDNLDTEAHRILFDEDEADSPKPEVKKPSESAEDRAEADKGEAPGRD